MAIVMVAAINNYFTQHSQGVMPGQGFLMDFIRPFIEMERLEAKLEPPLTAHERQMAEGKMMMLKHTCAERIGPKMTRDKNSSRIHDDP